MICGRLPSLIASLPDSVGICTFIIIRMLTLPRVAGPTRGERQIRASAKALRTGSPAERDRTGGERHKAPTTANLRPRCDARQVDAPRPELVRRLTRRRLSMRLDTASSCDAVTHALSLSPATGAPGQRWLYGPADAPVPS